MKSFAQTFNIWDYYTAALECLGLLYLFSHII